MAMGFFKLCSDLYGCWILEDGEDYWVIAASMPLIVSPRNTLIGLGFQSLSAEVVKYREVFLCNLVAYSLTLILLSFLRAY